MTLINTSTPPGTQVNISASPALPGSFAGNTGAWFVAGLTQKGPVGVPVTLASMNDFLTLLGSRWPTSSLYDAAQLYFTLAGEGGTMYVSRVVGPSATPATVSLKDSANTATLTVSAQGPGSYGNSLSVAVIAGPTNIAGSYQLVVYEGGVAVETSPPLVTTSDAVNWGTLSPAASTTFCSKYITVADLGIGIAPAVVAATALSAGTDDDADAGDTQFEAAYAVFGSAMGPGQVSAPGRTTTATLTAVQNHATTYNRVALLDAVNGANASTIATAAAAQQSAPASPNNGTMCAGWILYPGLGTGNGVPAWNRQIPPCAAAAGLMAANDTTNDCNVAAAGNNGFVAGALGVAQTFSDSDRATLNAAGVCPFVVDQAGNTKLDGYTSLAIDPQWQDLANVRFAMQVKWQADLIGNNYDFSQVDGAGQTIAAFTGALVAMLQGYWSAGSLYGATPGAAFSVNTGPTVNTSQTIANRQLNAQIAVCMSPSAQWVVINVVKYQVGQVIPAGATGAAPSSNSTSS